MFDLIGDIHGHAAELEELLRRMGYRHRAGAWRHPERTAIFVGDFLDPKGASRFSGWLMGGVSSTSEDSCRVRASCWIDDRLVSQALRCPSWAWHVARYLPLQEERA